MKVIDRYEIAKYCIDKVGVDRQIIEKIMETATVINDEKYKKFLACSYKLQGYQNENGKILLNNVKQFLKDFYSDKELIKLDICQGYDSPNHGDNAYNALDCFLTQLKTIKSN